MFKLSFVFVLLTTPFLSSGIYYGVPFWVYASLAMTLIYASILVFVIEKRWHALKDTHE